MAEHTIDELELKIQSDAKSASDGLERLVESLTGLKSVVGQGQNGLSDFAKKLQDFNKSINELSDTEKVSKSIGDIEKSVQNLSKTPIKMDFESIETAIEQLREKFRDAGADLKIEGNTASIEKAIENTTAQLDKLLAKEDKIRAIGGNFNTEGFKALEYDISVAYNKLDALRDKLEEIQSDGKPLKFTDEWLANLPSMKEEAAQTAESISEEFQKINYVNPEFLNYSKSLLKAVGMDETLKSWNDAVQKFGANTAAQLNIADTAMEKAKIDTENFKAVLNSLKDIQPRIDETALDRLENKLKSVEQEKERLEYELEKGLRLGRIDVDDKAYQNLEIKIREAENTAESLRQKIAEVSNQAAISSKEAAAQFEQNLANLKIPPINETNLQRLQASLRKIEDDLDKFRAKLENDITMGRIVANVDDSGYRKAREQIELTEKSIEATKAKIASLDGAEGQQTFNGLTDSMSRVANVSKSITVIFANIGKSAKSLFSRIRSLVPSFQGLGTAVKNLISRMGKLGKAFASFAKSHKKTDMSLKDGIKTLLKYGLGIRSLFVLFNRLRSAAKEGLGNLVQYSEDANRSVSLITSALGALKNSFAAAFAPIMNVVAPYITSFINMMIDASNAVARFLAALTGKTIATQAKKYYKDYADSLNGVADAAKKADKALHTLAIDELNIINETDEATDDQITIEDMFEDVAIESKISDWANKIRDAFLNHDWEGLGKTIADLINKGLKRLYDLINWDNVGDKITKAIKAFTETFNSLVENLDWDLLGRTIGAGINTLAKAFNLLVGEGGIDFENLGKKLSVGFRGLIDEVEWEEVGNALGNAWMISWRILDGFITDMARKSDLGLTGWQELGQAFAELVNGIFDKVKFETVGRVLAEGLNGIFQAIDMASSLIGFKEIAENFRDGVNIFINLANLGDWGATIGKTITKLVEAVNVLLDQDTGIKFEKFGKKFANGLRNLVTNINFEEVGNMIGNGIMSIFNFLKGAVDELGRKVENMTGWQEIGRAIANAINGIFDKVSFPDIANTISKAINGIFESIKQMTSDFRWGDIAKNISNGLNTAINNIEWAKNGRSLNKLMSDFLGMLLDVAKKTEWEKFGKGIGDFLSQIEWKKHFNTIFETIKTVLGGLIDGLKETVVGRIGLAVGSAVVAFQGLEKIVSVITAVFGPKAGATAAAVAGIAALVAAMVVGGKDLAVVASDMIKGFLDKLIETVRNTDWGEVWKNIIEFLGNFDAYGILNKLRELAIVLIGHLVTGLIEAIFETNWIEFAQKLVQGMIMGIMSVIDGLFEVAKLIFEAIYNGIRDLFGIHSPSTVMAEIGVFIVQGLIEGIKSLIEEVVGLFRRLWEDIQNIWKDVASWFDSNVTQPIIGFFRNVYENVSSFFRNLWSEIQSVWESVANWFNTNVVQPLIGFFQDVHDKVYGFFSDLWESIKTLWENAVTWFNTNIVQPLIGIFGEVYQKVYGFFSDLWNGIQKLWSDAVTWFNTNIIQPLIGFFEEIYTKVSGFFKDLWADIQSVWESVANWFDDHVIQPVIRFFDKLGEAFQKIIDFITGEFHEKWQSAWEGVTEIFKNIFGGILSVAETIINGLINIINSAIRGINKITDLIGFNSIPEIPSVNFTSSLSISNLEGIKIPVVASIASIEGYGNAFSAYGTPVTGDAISAYANDISASRSITVLSGGTRVADNFDPKDMTINNSEMISDIERAMESVLAPYLADIAQYTKETADKDFGVSLDGRTLVSELENRRARNGWSFAT